MTSETMNVLDSVALNAPHFHFRRLGSMTNSAGHNEIEVLALLFYRFWFLLGCFLIRLLFILLLFLVVSSMLTPSAGPAMMRMVEMENSVLMDSRYKMRVEPD